MIVVKNGVEVFVKKDGREVPAGVLLNKSALITVEGEVVRLSPMARNFLKRLLQRVRGS